MLSLLDQNNNWTHEITYIAPHNQPTQPSYLHNSISRRSSCNIYSSSLTMNNWSFLSVWYLLLLFAPGIGLRSVAISLSVCLPASIISLESHHSPSPRCYTCVSAVGDAACCQLTVDTCLYWCWYRSRGRIILVRSPLSCQRGIPTVSHFTSPLQWVVLLLSPLHCKKSSARRPRIFLWRVFHILTEPVP